MPADMAPSPMAEVARHRHAERRRDRGRGMRRPERVEVAFRPPRESGKAAGRPQRPDAVAPPGQNLVWIGLMPDIPDQPVARRIEDIVQRHRQLDHAQPGSEMPAGHRHRRDRLLPQFVGNLFQRRFRQASKVFR